MFTRPSFLIQVDWIAASVVGVLMLLLHRWLAGLYGLPAELLLGLGIVNLGYGCFSFTLACLRRGERVPLFRVLAGANIAWAVACVVLACVWFGTATPLGVAVLLIEALLVGGLGILEWLASRIRETE